MFDFDFGNNKKIYQCHDHSKIIQFCMENELLNKEMYCSRCKSKMKISSRVVLDDTTWRCSTCKTYKSIREGSSFQAYKLSFGIFFKLMFSYLTDVKQADCAKNLNMGASTVRLYYERSRIICSYDLDKTTLTLVDKNKIVEIEESMFAKVKHHRGKDLYRKQ